MAADLGLSPEILETDESPPERGPVEPPVVAGAGSLMERLRGRYGQHKSWSDTIKALKLATMNDKRHHSDALDKPKLQANLDKLQRAMKIINQQSLIERLDLISRQLGLIFTPPTPPDNHITLCSDMFKVVIVLDGQSGIKDVRIGHQENPTSCEDLVEVLSNGVFDEFIKHLQGLLAIYSIEGDRKQKTKGYLALSSLESDLNLLAQLQSSINGVANYIHKSPLGILLPRRGGHPMKLIYFVSPYDLLCKRTLSSYPMTVEAITENDLGHSVTICMEPSPTISKLQTMPLMSVKTNADGKSMPSFQAVNNINSYSLPASFVLMLPQPVPIAESVICAIQDITGLDIVCGVKRPLLQVLMEDITRGKMSNTRELFVTLPDQQHIYYLQDDNSGENGGLPGGCLSEPGALVDKIAFQHPTAVPTILNLLRQQLLFNSVVRSLVRPAAKQDYKSAVVFELTAMSLQYLSVMFEHPLQDSMVTVEFDLADVTSVKCRLCMNNRDESICSNDFVSRAFQRCFSIPITLRTVLHKVRQEIISLSPPEPVLKKVTKLCMKWTSHLALKAAPPPPCATNVNVNTNSVPQNVLSNLPNPPPYPANDSWVQGAQLDGRNKINAPLNRNFMEPPAPSEDRQPSNPLLATLLDADSPAVDRSPQSQAMQAQTLASSQSQPASIVNESPMLSKLLEENTSVATNPFPAPTPATKRRLTKRKSSKDMIAGKSPKHRLSDSDMAERTSVSATSSGERYGQGIGEKHIDLDSSGGSYDSEPQRPASVSSVGSAGGQSTGSVIDLTDINIGESHVKKLENSLDSIMQKEQRVGGVGVSPGAPGMNSQPPPGMLDMMDAHMHMPDYHHHHNQHHHPHHQPQQQQHHPGMPGVSDGGPGGMMPDFQPPQQWAGGNNRGTPPAPGLRTSPHHRVLPKNEKISTSLEELLLGPRGRENDGPYSARRNSQPTQRRHSLKRQNSAGGRSSVDSLTGGVSPDVFSPMMTSPIHFPSMSPGGQYPMSLSSPNHMMSPGGLPPYPTMSPGGGGGHSTVTSPSHLSLANIKVEAFETKPGFMSSSPSSSSSASVTSFPRMSVNSVHAVASGKPSLSALKAQLEMRNDGTLENRESRRATSLVDPATGCLLPTQDKDFKQDDNSNSSTGSQPPLMKLKLSNMRQYDSISPADSSEDSSKARSCTFDFHSDDEDTLPLVDKIMVVSASPTRLQISNKSTIASFNKFNKSEKFKRKEREKEMKHVVVDEPVGKRKRDRDETRKERKKKRVSNNTYSIENDMAVYKSTTVDVEGSTENNKHKPMPKLKITKSGIKTIENNSVQIKEIKPVKKVEGVKVEKIEKLDKQAVVKIEKVEKYVKKEKDKDSSVQDLSNKESLVKEMSIKDSGVKDLSIKDSSVKESNVKDFSVKDSCVRDLSVKDSSVKEASVKESNIKDLSLKDSSFVVKKETKEAKEKSSEKVTEKVERVSTPVSKSSSVSDEGIFDRINAMKTENVSKGDGDSVGEKNSPLNTSNPVTSKKSLNVSKSKPHKSQRSNSSTKSDLKMIRTPTIKLKPIEVPHTSSSSGTRTPTTPGSASTPSTPKSVAQSPTSTTIGKIGAVSFATSGSQKSLVPPSSGKSPQGPPPKSSSSSKSSSSVSGLSVLSSKSTNSSQKNIQAQNSSGKNSPIPQSNKSRSLSSSNLNSVKLEKGMNKSLSSSSNRTSSPLSDREKSKLNSSSRSSSSSGRDRDREKSTSSSKNSVPEKTVITQETAASVLSFLNPKANKISSLPPIPKLSSAASGQKVSTPTSSTNTTIVSSASIATSATISPSNTTSKFTKGNNPSNSRLNASFPGANTSKNTNATKGTNSSVSSSQKSSHSFNKSNSHNKPHSSVTNTVNASRTGTNSPVNYSQKNSGSYNKGNNPNSANNSAFRNNSSSNIGHNRTPSSNSSSSSGSTGQMQRNTSASGSVSPHKGSNSNASGQGPHRSNSTSSGNRGGNSTTSSSGSSAGRPSNTANTSSSNSANFRGSNTGPNAPKGPGPPVSSHQSVSSSEESSKVKPHTPHTSQAGSRGRKGSLSAVIDKLTCKATIPPPYSSTSTNTNKGDKVIIDESPASPEPDAPSVEKKSKTNEKVVIFDAPASPEPDNSSMCNSVGSKAASGDKMVSIPLDQQLSQNSDTGSSASGESTNRRHSSDIPEKILPKSFNSELSTSSPKIIPLDSPKDRTKSPFNKHLTKQRSFDSSSPQQNGDISSDESSRLKAMERAKHRSDSSENPTVTSKPQDTKVSSAAVTERTKDSSVFKVPSPKNSLDSRLGSDSPAGMRKARSNSSSIKAINSPPSSPPSSPENGLMIDISMSPEDDQYDIRSPVCNSVCDTSPVLGQGQDRTPVTPTSNLKAVGIRSKVRSVSSESAGVAAGKDNSTENSRGNSPCFLDDDLMDEALGLGN